MVEKMTFWRSVGIGFGVTFILFILLIKTGNTGNNYAVVHIISLLLVGGFIAGYLFKEGIKGGMKVGFAVSITPIFIILTLISLTGGWGVMNFFDSILLSSLFCSPIVVFCLIGGVIGGAIARLIDRLVDEKDKII